MRVIEVFIFCSHQLISVTMDSTKLFFKIAILIFTIVVPISCKIRSAACVFPVTCFNASATLAISSPFAPTTIANDLY